MTFTITKGDFSPYFGYWQGGTISTGEGYTNGNLTWKNELTPYNAEYRNTRICYEVVVRITIYNKSDNTGSVIVDITISEDNNGICVSDNEKKEF